MLATQAPACKHLFVFPSFCPHPVQAALEKLWEACFPHETPDTGPNERWKDAGFQGEDPANDFRGGGIFALLNLLYMAEHYNDTFRRLMTKADGQRSEWEYPFSVAGAHSSEMYMDRRRPVDIHGWQCQ